LADDLRRYLAGEPTLARPVSPAERAWPLVPAQPPDHGAERGGGALRIATGDDFRDPMVLKTDPDLVPLENESAYQALLSELEPRSN
jgi:hypothetical protein